jgi:hypothetical protein
MIPIAICGGTPTVVYFAAWTFFLVNIPNFYFSGSLGGTGCTFGYNKCDFLKKMKNTDPVMGAKLKSKTHLQNMFFLFFVLFLSS